MFQPQIASYEAILSFSRGYTFSSFHVIILDERIGIGYMQKKGFIATSLIYSFFLAFIAVVAVLLNSYIANKTILDRFNEKVQEELNSVNYTVTIRSRNANIRSGMTISNLIANGDFSKNLDFWNKEGEAQFSTDHYSLIKSNPNVNHSYLYQNVYLLEGNKYYMRVDYQHDSDTPLYTYLGVFDENNALSTTKNFENGWYRDTQKYEANATDTFRFTLGDSGDAIYSGNTYFSNVMLINLTASFGAGYEPDTLWVDANIDWFNGTISYLVLTGLEYESKTSIEFTPYLGYDEPSIRCVDDDGRAVSSYTMSPGPSRNPSDGEEEESSEEDGSESDEEVDPGDIDKRTPRTFEIREIKSNIRCDIDWSKP